MVDYRFSSPFIAAGIDELSEASVGSGFYTSAKELSVKRTADDWLHEIDLDTMNRDISSDIWMAGNSILEQIDPPPKLEDLIHLPIGSFKKIYSNKYGKITKVEQDIEGTRNTFEGEQVNKLLMLRWNVTGTSPLGHGLLESLMTQGVGYTYKDADGNFQTVYRPSFREAMEEIEDAMRKIVVGYVPLHVFTFYGMDDAWVTSQGKVIKALIAGDKLVVGLPSGDEKENKLTTETLETDPRSRLHPYTKYFHDGVITGLETPSVRLFIEAGFTEASARTAVELRDQKVASFRRYYKRQVERMIVKPYVMQKLSLTETRWKSAKFRIHWNPLEPPKITTEQLIALLSAQAKAGVWVIKPEELREMFKKRGVELEEEPTTKEMQLIRKVFENQVQKLGISKTKWRPIMKQLSGEE